jgi:hypothetical protein
MFRIKSRKLGINLVTFREHNVTIIQVGTCRRVPCYRCVPLTFPLCWYLVIVNFYRHCFVLVSGVVDCVKVEMATLLVTRSHGQLN